MKKERSEGFTIMNEKKIYKYIYDIHRPFLLSQALLQACRYHNMARALDVDERTRRDVITAMHDRTMVEKALVKTRKNQE